MGRGKEVGVKNIFIALSIILTFAASVGAETCPSGIECGYVPECDISVDKKCQVGPTDPGTFKCDDKVDALEMI